VILLILKKQKLKLVQWQVQVVIVGMVLLILEKCVMMGIMIMGMDVHLFAILRLEELKEMQIYFGF